MIQASLNHSVPLQLLAADGRADLFAQINVYTNMGTLLSSLSAPHMAEGVYVVHWTPAIQGYYSIVGTFYFDPGFTVEAGYEKAGDTVDVSSIKTDVLRLLGLHYDNSVVDQQVFDDNGNLLTARVRSYDSKSNALLAGATGLLFSYTIRSSYSGGYLTNYTMCRDL